MIRQTYAIAAAVTLVTTAHCAGPRASTAPDQKAAPAASSRPLPPALVGELPVTTWNGRATTLQQVAAPITVLALWSSDCKTCLEELPYLEALHQRSHADNGVRVVLVNTDSADNLARAKELTAPMHLSLPMVVDDQRQIRCRLRQAFGVEYFPHSKAKSEELDLVPVPLVAVLGSGATVWGENRHGMSERADDFVAAKLDLIALAKAGKLPEKKPPLRLLKEAIIDPGLQFDFPVLNEEQIARELPRIDRAISVSYPKITSEARQKLLQQAREAMRRGGKALLVP